MPVIIVDGPELSKEKKTQLIQELTKKTSEIMGIPTNAYTVIIKENNPDNIGVGGTPLSEIKK